MKHKVAELLGAELDAAVAKAEGEQDVVLEDWGRGLQCTMVRCFERVPFCPSRSWSYGGPIIDRERIELLYLGDSEWQSACNPNAIEAYDIAKWSYANTPLIAAMRAYVASKFGDEVEL